MSLYLLNYFVSASKASIATSRLNSLAAASVSKSLATVSLSSMWAAVVKFALKRLHGQNKGKTTRNTQRNNQVDICNYMWFDYELIQ